MTTTAGHQHAPAVTLGLPVYNGEPWVDEAITSIRKQDYDDLELLISDNGSVDGTEAICRDHAASDDRVRYWRQPENRGASFNFGFVATKARGRLFKWASHDDVLEPTYLSRCVAVLDDDPEVVLCQASIIEIDEAGVAFNEWPRRAFCVSPSAPERFADVVLRAGETYHSLGVVRTGVLRTTLMLAPFPSSDLALLAELALHGRFHDLPEHLYRRRAHRGQSIRAYANERQRAAWFDPRRSRAISYPGWRLGLEYGRAARRVLSDAGDRRAAYGHLAHWAWLYHDRLARDLAWGMREHVYRSPVGRRLGIR